MYDKCCLCAPRLAVGPIMILDLDEVGPASKWAPQPSGPHIMWAPLHVGLATKWAPSKVGPTSCGPWTYVGRT